METITIDKDIKVFYVTATSFPEGIMEAYEKLHALVPFSSTRKYYGISRPENNSGIVYKAAAEETSDGEAAQYNLETLILKKGNYVCDTIEDYKKDVTSIGQTFQQLLSQPNVDPEGYCVEVYLNDGESVDCIVRLKDKQ